MSGQKDRASGRALVNEAPDGSSPQAASIPDAGTFACPICGKEKPHNHTDTEIGEHVYQRVSSATDSEPAFAPEGTLAALEDCAAMLEEWGPRCFPANRQGQVHFARSMMDATAKEIRTFLARTQSKDTPQ